MRLNKSYTKQNGCSNCKFMMVFPATQVSDTLRCMHNGVDRPVFEGDYLDHGRVEILKNWAYSHPEVHAYGTCENWRKGKRKV